jgi:hypothetical protein
MNLRSPGPYQFNTTERIRAHRPKRHILYIRDACKGKTVLDIGCLDETAYNLKSKDSMLHFQIGQVAKTLIGMDNSPELQGKILETGYSRIYPIDLYSDDLLTLSKIKFDVIVCSMVLEHLTNPIKAIRRIRNTFPGAELIITTTNATGITNVIAAVGSREIQHADHISTFSYKTLDNVVVNGGYKSFSVFSLYVAYPEAKERILKGQLPYLLRFLGGGAIHSLEKLLNLIEYLFPLFATGLIAHCYPTAGKESSNINLEVFD